MNVIGDYSSGLFADPQGYPTKTFQVVGQDGPASPQPKTIVSTPSGPMMQFGVVGPTPEQIAASKVWNEERKSIYPWLYGSDAWRTPPIMPEEEQSTEDRLLEAIYGPTIGMGGRVPGMPFNRQSGGGQPKISSAQMTHMNPIQPYGLLNLGQLR